MSLYEGSCHCGEIRFRIDVAIEYVVDCNCTVCVKKGILHVPVEDDRFEILQGEDSLALYQWKTNTAKHWFCRHCGIHTFGRPRNHPDRYTVNARCLHDFETVMATVPTRQFDGQNHPKDQT